MIDFACRTVDFKDILTCSFGLNKTEYELLLFLLEKAAALPVAEISLGTKLERSTVQKAITKLYEKNVVDRRQINLQGGGYQFIYAAADKEILKKKLFSIVQGWNNNVNEAISKW